MIAEQDMLSFMMVIVIMIMIMIVIVIVIVPKIVKNGGSVNDFVNLPPSRGNHQSTDQQYLKKASELKA